MLLGLGAAWTYLDARSFLVFKLYVRVSVVASNVRIIGASGGMQIARFMLWVFRDWSSNGSFVSVVAEGS